MKYLVTLAIMIYFTLSYKSYANSEVINRSQKQLSRMTCEEALDAYGKCGPPINHAFRQKPSINVDKHIILSYGDVTNTNLIGSETKIRQ